MRTVASVFALLIAGLILWRVREVIVTVLLALVMAYILRPMVNQFCAISLRLRGRELRLPRAAAVGLVFIFLAFILWAVWVISADSIRHQAQEFRSHWPAYQVVLQQEVQRVVDLRRDLPESLGKSADAWVESLAAMATGAVHGGVRAALANVGMLVELILVPILAFYILADGRAIRQQVLFFVPRRHLAWTEHALTQSDDAFQRFIRGQVVLCLIAFVVVTAGAWAIGLDFYLLLGVVAGVTRAIPIVGPVVGAIPIIIVLLLAKQSLAFTIWVIAVFALLHLLESKLLMPAVLGRELKLHPALIIVALLIGAQVAGLLGMFLAAPVLAVVRTLIAERRQEAPAAV
jgi:predicted PurR-regulated permease PerM